MGEVTAPPSSRSCWGPTMHYTWEHLVDLKAHANLNYCQEQAFLTEQLGKERVRVVLVFVFLISWLHFGVGADFRGSGFVGLGWPGLSHPSDDPLLLVKNDHQGWGSSLRWSRWTHKPTPCCRRLAHGMSVSREEGPFLRAYHLPSHQIQDTTAKKWSTKLQVYNLP